MPHARNPLSEPCAYYVLLESSDAEGEAHAVSAFETLMSDAFEAELVTDAAIASSLAQSKAFWHIRHYLPEAQAFDGENVKHDISLPISGIAAFIEAGREAVHKVLPNARIFVFGHLGDGNLHYNVSAPEGASEAEYRAMRGNEKAISSAIYDVVAQAGGSISAEHGVGQLRVHSIARYKSAQEMNMMRQIKRVFDPDNLFNPGRVVTPEA